MLGANQSALDFCPGNSMPSAVVWRDSSGLPDDGLGLPVLPDVGLGLPVLPDVGLGLPGLPYEVVSKLLL